MVTHARSAPVVTFTGATLRPRQLVETLSKFISLRNDPFSFTTRCEGKYSFIGNGTGGDNKITFAEAWQGK